MTLSLLYSIFFVTASWEGLRRFPIHVLNETLYIDVGFSLVANTYDMNIVEPLEYNFGTVSVATNNFSEDNKIGQGGFGSVYKVCIHIFFKRPCHMGFISSCIEKWNKQMKPNVLKCMI